MELRYLDKPAFLFPAWAGVILICMDKKSMWLAFPRMGGGDPAAAAARAGQVTFSPHGRG